MNTNKKILTTFISLVVLIVLACAVYAIECPEGYSPETTNQGKELCKKDGEYLLTENNFNDIPAGSSFTTGDKEILFIGGEKIKGKGTKTADGKIALDPKEGSIITQEGNIITGQAIYNPQNKKVSFGSEGGQIEIRGVKSYFKNANDIQLLGALMIKGTCGRECVTPIGRLEENTKFTIELQQDEEGKYYSAQLYGCSQTCTVTTATGLPGRTRFENTPINIKTNGEILKITEGKIECTQEGCYVPKKESAVVNGIKISDKDKKTDLIVTSDPNKKPTPHSVMFYKFDTPGERGIIVSSDDANNPVTADIIQKGLFGYEEGDTLKLTATNGNAELTEKPCNDKINKPCLTVQGKTALVNDKATIKFDGKDVVGENFIEGSNSVELLMQFKDEKGNLLKVGDQNWYISFRNVNINECLNTTGATIEGCVVEEYVGPASLSFTTWLSGPIDQCIIPEESQTPPTEGSATSFLGKASVWITGKAAKNAPQQKKTNAQCSSGGKCSQNLLDKKNEIPSQSCVEAFNTIYMDELDMGADYLRGLNPKCQYSCVNKECYEYFYKYATEGFDQDNNANTIIQNKCSPTGSTYKENKLSTAIDYDCAKDRIDYPSGFNVKCGKIKIPLAEYCKAWRSIWAKEVARDIIKEANEEIDNNKFKPQTTESSSLTTQPLGGETVQPTAIESSNQPQFEGVPSMNSASKFEKGVYCSKVCYSNRCGWSCEYRLTNPEGIGGIVTDIAIGMKNSATGSQSITYFYFPCKDRPTEWCREEIKSGGILSSPTQTGNIIHCGRVREDGKIPKSSPCHPNYQPQKR